jgi:hypothetical protein
MVNDRITETALAIHEHGITEEDKDGINATVTGVEEYVKEHIWQILENQMLDAGVIQDTGDKAYAMIEIGVRELINKLNTDKHR